MENGTASYWKMRAYRIRPHFPIKGYQGGPGLFNLSPDPSLSEWRIENGELRMNRVTSVVNRYTSPLSCGEGSGERFQFSILNSPFPH
jgi:hypothetical protein